MNAEEEEEVDEGEMQLLCRGPPGQSASPDANNSSETRRARHKERAIKSKLAAHKKKRKATDQDAGQSDPESHQTEGGRGAPSSRETSPEPVRATSPERIPASDETASLPAELPAVVDEETASRTAVQKLNQKAYGEGGRWSEYPDALPFNPASVPEKLAAKPKTVKQAKKGTIEEMYEDLKAHVEANLAFKENAKYMYIFGQDKHFQLGVEDMTNSDAKSGTIYRPLEEEGIAKVLKHMTDYGFNKQILTVMPNTRTRPTNWLECVRAGKFLIINGQHTWAAAKMILEGKVPNIHENIKSRVSLWTCDIVWTDKPAHLHSLSYKCNDGNDEQPHLTSAPATVAHLREIWSFHGRPKQFRKNRRVVKGSEEEKLAMQYEVRDREQIQLVRYGLSGRSLRNLSVQCQSCNA